MASVKGLVQNTMMDTECLAADETVKAAYMTAIGYIRLSGLFIAPDNRPHTLTLNARGFLAHQQNL